jgi:hypothetical protein
MIKEPFMPHHQQDTRQLLADSARVAQAARNWTFSPPDQRATSIVLRFFTSLDTAVERVMSSQPLRESLDSIPVDDAVNGYFPALGPKHPLSAETWLGFELMEPQVGRGIAHFLGVADEPEENRRRCRAVLRALLPGEPADSAFMLSLEQTRDLCVQAEAPCNFSGNNRMDLEFRWSGTDKIRRVAVVEMKFGADVGKGQLPKYRSHALYYGGRNLENVRLILLTVTGKRHRGRRKIDHQDWIPVSWINFLRCWEQEIATDNSDSEAFRYFRYQLWSKVED